MHLFKYKRPDAVTDPWLKELLQKVLAMHPLPQGVQIINSEVRPPPKYNVTYVNSLVPETQTAATQVSQHQPSMRHPFPARLVSNDRVTALGHWQDVKLVKFDISGSGIRYSPGDVVMVQPSNLEDVVEEFINFLHLDPEETFILEQNDVDIPLPHRLPSPCSIRYLVEHYLDIQGVPRRYFFELLSHFTTSALEKERLQEFSSTEGQEDLYSYCIRQRRSTLEVLQDFPSASANIPFDYLFDLIPPIQPRAFSIASSLMAHPDEIHVLMAVVQYKTKIAKPRRGLCSTWLSSLDASTSDRIHVWAKKGTITLPKNLNTPLIMIGPGTGVAPFRSFIEERVTRGGRDCVLFFGSRNKSSDFFFEDQWLHMKQQGTLQLFTAFSRDQEDKIYVQHRMRESSALIWDLVSNKNASCYLAGNSKRMPTDVKEALIDVFKNEGGMDENQANEYYNQLERTKRYQAETWS